MEEIEESEISEGFQIKDGDDDHTDDDTDVVDETEEEDSKDDDRESSDPDDFNANDPELMAYMFNEEEM